MNPLTCIDFYKADHRRQYPEGTQLVYSNFTPRGDRHCKIPEAYNRHEVTFFGLQYFLKHFLLETWNREFFEQPKEEVVLRYKRRLDTSLGLGAVPVEHIEALHDLGYLPICIRALPEGTAVPIRVPVLVIFNTLPRFFWLTNYLETILSCYLWKPITTATIARHYRLMLQNYAEITGADTNFIDFQAHDFSFRGMSGPEDAALSGAAHLVFFKGTDTVPAIDLIEDFYVTKDGIGYSVPATEHSVMCMGEKESEVKTFERLITELYPLGIVSIVSDTWDFWTVITGYTVELKDKIMARKGKVVFRPDSGDPVDIVCGTLEPFEHDEMPDQAGLMEIAQWWKHFRVGKKFYQLCFMVDEGRYIAREAAYTPAMRGAVECLWEVFGGTKTHKGFRVLDPHVGLIYGDSITLDRAERILEKLARKNFSSDNIVLGIGSYTYQYVTRDTFGFAVKSTAGTVNGTHREIFKDPKTDDGLKKSLKGFIRVVEKDFTLVAEDQMPDMVSKGDKMQIVFMNGELRTETTFAQIRARARESNNARR